MACKDYRLHYWLGVVYNSILHVNITKILHKGEYYTKIPSLYGLNVFSQRREYYLRLKFNTNTQYEFKTLIILIVKDIIVFTRNSFCVIVMLIARNNLYATVKFL